MLSALLMACIGEPPSPPVSAPPPPVPQVRYVAASSLNLRASGAATAAKLGMLSINSPVTVLEPGRDWAKVEAANGAQGWVDADYLAAAPLTVDVARRQAQASEAPAAVLAWRQRAAALSPLDRTLLAELAEAYDGVGDGENAAMIRSQLAWPAHLLPVERIGAGGEVWLLVDTWLQEPPFDGELPSPDQAALLDYPGAGDWQVLPSIGAAVPAAFDRYERGVLNECAGDFGLWVVLSLSEPLPEGHRALVATRGPVPETWAEATAAPLLSREAAAEKLRVFAGGYTNEDLSIVLAPSGETWLGTARWMTSEEEDFFTTSEGVLVRVLADGALRLIREERHLDMLSLRPVGQRDLDGDGSPETFWGGCEVDIFGDGGLLETSTPNTCCGC